MAVKEIGGFYECHVPGGASEEAGDAFDDAGARISWSEPDWH
jgi:hypothetical protein